MNIALNKYTQLPNIAEPNLNSEFAKYVTVHFADSSKQRAKLAFPFKKTWREFIDHITKGSNKYVVWCKELGVLNTEEQMLECIDCIRSCEMWILSALSFYGTCDHTKRNVFKYLSDFNQLAILCVVCKEWNRVAKCDGVVDLAYRRDTWLWSGVDQSGHGENDIWERDRRRLGLSLFDLSRWVFKRL